MIYQLLVLVVIIIFFVNLVLNLLFLKRPSKKAGLPAALPLVSVLIPARNEEANIADCVTSMLKQDYPNYEILVLDDNSSDRTTEIVSEIAGKDQRVQLLKGKPLPDGWAGKCFACHQLSQAAKGDWLLFMDADTRSEPHTIRSTLAIAIDNKIAMLTGCPRQKVSGVTQKIVIPILLYFIIMSWFPLWWLHRSMTPLPTLAIGQFLLFRREDYDMLGGHQHVKARIMEDVWFAIEMSKYGGRTLSIDLSKTVSTIMYRNIGSMAEGCMKWFYSVAALSSFALLGFFMAAYIFYLAPFYWLMTATFNPFNGLWSDVSVIIALQVGLLLLMRIITDLYFRGSALSFIFHPLGMAFLVISMLYAFGRRAFGAGVAWKDRVYHSYTQIK